MEWLTQLIGFILHIDQYLQVLFTNYGLWIYGLLFLIIFCETGLVVTPFLPGDSLLFAAGSIIATTELNIHLLAGLLILAAVLGDALNYWIGHWAGPKVFSQKGSILFNPSHLMKAREFYHRYGGKAIILGRFLPIIRTFVPFVAGIGAMGYQRFLCFNILGAILWVAGITYLGYWFGNVGWVKDNFSLVIIGIIIASVIPAALEFIRIHCKKSSDAKPS